MYTLEEILEIASQIKPSEIILYTAVDTRFSQAGDGINLSIPYLIFTPNNANPSTNINNALLDLNNEVLTQVITYFEPIEPTCININPACLRIYLENILINPLQLFEKIANKTVFIVHTKNSEYCRTGPFIFNDLTHFFEALFTFNGLSEINSSGGGTICTVAYLDIYNY